MRNTLVKIVSAPNLLSRKDTSLHLLVPFVSLAGQAIEHHTRKRIIQKNKVLTEKSKQMSKQKSKYKKRIAHPIFRAQMMIVVLGELCQLIVSTKLRVEHLVLDVGGPAPISSVDVRESWVIRWAGFQRSL
jgi:hypothetical protein